MGTVTLCPGSSTRSGSANANTPAAAPAPAPPAASPPAPAAAVLRLSIDWLRWSLLLLLPLTGEAPAPATACIDGELCMCGKCGSCWAPLLWSRCAAAAAAEAGAAAVCCLWSWAGATSAAPLDLWRRCMARCFASVMTSVPAADKSIEVQQQKQQPGKAFQHTDAWMSHTFAWPCTTWQLHCMLAL